MEELDKTLFTAVCANDVNAAKFYIMAGADVNARFINNVTPLIKASHNRNRDLVRLLVEAGANIHAADDYLNTAFSYARSLSFYGILIVLNSRMIELWKEGYSNEEDFY